MVIRHIVAEMWAAEGTYSFHAGTGTSSGSGQADCSGCCCDVFDGVV